jgi:hypothetical protein
MENWIEETFSYNNYHVKGNHTTLEKSVIFYDVMFDGVLYEVEMTNGNISDMFRVDGFEMEDGKREAIKDFVYKNNK